MKAGGFYKMCAAFPQICSEDSPSVRTTIGHTDGKRHPELRESGICYLAKYNDAKKLGLIFLGVGSPKPEQWQFYLKVSGYENRLSDGFIDDDKNLRTIPPKAFESSFYLNVSEPIRVRIQCIQPFNDLRRLHLPLPPPVFGVREHFRVPSAKLPIPPTVILDPRSESTFFGIRRVYFHRYNPEVDGSLRGEVDGSSSSGVGEGFIERSSGVLDEGDVVEGQLSLVVNTNSGVRIYGMKNFSMPRIDANRVEANDDTIGQYLLDHDIPIDNFDPISEEEDSEEEEDDMTSETDVTYEVVLMDIASFNPDFELE